jgi:hypothetical protein
VLVGNCQIACNCDGRQIADSVIDRLRDRRGVGVSWKLSACV